MRIHARPINCTKVIFSVTGTIVLVFKDEEDAEAHRSILEPLGWKPCSAGGPFNAWEAPHLTLVDVGVPEDATAPTHTVTFGS